MVQEPGHNQLWKLLSLQLQLIQLLALLIKLILLRTSRKQRINTYLRAFTILSASSANLFKPPERTDKIVCTNTGKLRNHTFFLKHHRQHDPHLTWSGGGGHQPILNFKIMFSFSVSLTPRILIIVSMHFFRQFTNNIRGIRPRLGVQWGHQMMRFNLFYGDSC